MFLSKKIFFDVGCRVSGVRCHALDLRTGESSEAEIWGVDVTYGGGVAWHKKKFLPHPHPAWGAKKCHFWAIFALLCVTHHISIADRHLEAEILPADRGLRVGNAGHIQFDQS